VKGSSFQSFPFVAQMKQIMHSSVQDKLGALNIYYIGLHRFELVQESGYRNN
jgi:hypothetical protein